MVKLKLRSEGTQEGDAHSPLSVCLAQKAMFTLIEKSLKDLLPFIVIKPSKY